MDQRQAQRLMEVGGEVGLTTGDAAAIAEFAGLLATDPSKAPGSRSAEQVQVAHRVRARLDAVTVGWSAAFDTSMAWAADGAGSASGWMAVQCEVSKGRAVGDVALGRALRDLPVAADAARCGRLGIEKVRLLTATRTEAVARVFDAQEAYLVETVSGLTVAGAQRFLRSWQLRAMADGGNEEASDDQDRDHLHLSSTFQGVTGWMVTSEPREGPLPKGRWMPRSTPGSMAVYWPMIADPAPAPRGGAGGDPLASRSQRRPARRTTTPDPGLGRRRNLGRSAGPG